ncbi:MAG: DUF928 domain-containing protein [Oscillatoriales cyanobacterium C42_A2020_001]|nr:DUF928 domain-containing protein [Leptolyngbyaceae cyanobacterium C42_A2020_001]
MLKSISPLWILPFLSASAMAIAQLSGLSMSATAAPLQPGQVVFNDPTPPNQGAPEGRQRGGASRKGPCDRYRPLAALIPNKQKIVFANTSSPHPTFWFYIPEPLTSASSIEFTLLDAQNAQADYTYKTTLSASEVKPGLIRLSVPTNATPLAVGKSYLWTLSLACNAKPADAVFVQGITQRVALSAKLQTQLSSAAPLEQATLYAANGIWHEALDAIALQHRDNPRRLQSAQAWNSLLQHIGLQDLASTPFSSCCTAPRSLKRHQPQ